MSTHLTLHLDKKLNLNGLKNFPYFNPMDLDWKNQIVHVLGFPTKGIQKDLHCPIWLLQWEEQVVLDTLTKLLQAGFAISAGSKLTRLSHYWNRRHRYETRIIVWPRSELTQVDSADIAIDRVNLDQQEINKTCEVWSSQIASHNRRQESLTKSWGWI